MSGETVGRAYGARADEYVSLFGSVEQLHPADREFIDLWSRQISGPVVDAGCGPGHWTAFLADRGLDVEGVDLTPEFVTSAQERFPQLPFRVGSLDDLGVEDGALGAILSWYSIIHTTPEHVPAQLAEFARCVRPGGSLLLGFFTGEPRTPFDHAVVRAYFWSVDAMREELATAGFEIVDIRSRAPEPGRRPPTAVIATRVPTSARHLT